MDTGQEGKCILPGKGAALGHLVHISLASVETGMLLRSVLLDLQLSLSFSQLGRLAESILQIRWKLSRVFKSRELFKRLGGTSF